MDGYTTYLNLRCNLPCKQLVHNVGTCLSHPDDAGGDDDRAVMYSVCMYVSAAFGQETKEKQPCHPTDDAPIIAGPRERGWVVW